MSGQGQSEGTWMLPEDVKEVNDQAKWTLGGGGGQWVRWARKQQACGGKELPLLKEETWNLPSWSTMRDRDRVTEVSGVESGSGSHCTPLAVRMNLDFAQSERPSCTVCPVLTNKPCLYTIRYHYFFSHPSSFFLPDLLSHWLCSGQNGHSAIKFHSPVPSLNISFRYTPSPYYRFKIWPQGVLWLEETSLLPQINGKLVSNHSWPLTLGFHCFWINTHYIPERFEVPAGGLAPSSVALLIRYFISAWTSTDCQAQPFPHLNSFSLPPCTPFLGCFSQVSSHEAMPCLPCPLCFLCH